MFEGETRKLKQFAYTSWPDHGVPLTTQELLGFRNAINSAVTNPDVPQLIHCSAGVGRTGTYIAIDRIMKQCLDMGGEINIDEIVKDMRMSRNFMVQTEVRRLSRTADPLPPHVCSLALSFRQFFRFSTCLSTARYWTR